MTTFIFSIFFCSVLTASRLLLSLSDKTFVLAFVLTDDEAEEGAGGARVEKRKGFVGGGGERETMS